MTKPVVFVIGATGNVGASVVASLSSKYADKVEIRAGVRNPEKADKIKSLEGVTVVQATMGDGELVQVLSGVHTLFITTPATENRVELATSTAELAKKAGVKHIAVVSVNTADFTGSIIADQFNAIEGKISSLGVPYTFIRLPNFFENYLGFKHTVISQGIMYAPVDPDKPFTSIAAAEDGGRASAAILVNPSAYANKTVTIVSERQTYNGVAQDFSAALGKEIKYVRVPYEDTRKTFLGAGTAEWQVNAALQYYKLVDSSNPAITSLDDIGTFTTITGEQPTSLKEWLAKNAAVFQ